MPGAIVHQWLISRLFAESLIQETFPDSAGPEIRSALDLGAVAPDMGVFPGGDPIVSNLAHYVRSGALCQQLLDTAHNDVERAFAWGWISHCLADILIHPLINRGAGELLHGNGERQVSYALNPAAHVRVELGLDSAMTRSSPNGLAIRVETRERSLRIDHLLRAYQATYGPINLRPALTRSLRACQRWSWAWLALARRHAHRFVDDGSISCRWSKWQIGVGQMLSSCLPRDSALRGLLRAKAPSDWLILEFHQLTTTFVNQFCAMIRNGQPNLPDANLDTGEVDSGTMQYPLAVATAHQWEQLKRKSSSSQ